MSSDGLGDVHVGFPFGIYDEGNDDDDGDGELYDGELYDDDESYLEKDEELSFKISSAFDSFSLMNESGYYLIDINEDGLLLETDIRSNVYDLTKKDRCLKITGFDEDCWREGYET